MNSRGYQSVTMERNVIIIILILISVFKSDLGFSSGEWFEIDGCHLLGTAIIENQTNLTENEPGGCLEWCGTKRVALQNSSCFCINDTQDTQNLTRTREGSCFQNCSGKEEIFKCGGNSSNIVSLYTERSDIAAGGSSNSSGCLTYSHTDGELVDRLVPDNCTANHPFYCYSETTYLSKECYRHTVMSDVRTWYGALEACRLRHPVFLWPAQNIKSCDDMYIQPGQYWVAVYQWTKVLPTSTTTSTTTTTSTPSTTLSTTTTTITTSTTSTSPTISLTSTISETSTTTTRSIPSSTTSSSSTVASSTTLAQNTSTTVLSSPSSISASTSTSTSIKSASTTRLPNASNDTDSPRHEAATFQINAPNIGIGLGIGLLVGIVISITINYFRMKIKRHTPRGTSSGSLTLQGIQHDAGKLKEQNMMTAFSNGTAYTSFSQLKGEDVEHGDTNFTNLTNDTNLTNLINLTNGINDTNDTKLTKDTRF